MSDTLIDRLFLGAGAMKAGTTWLYAVLSRHPEIHFSYEKEVHYFYARAVRSDVLSDRARLRNVEQKYLRFDPERTNPAALRARFRWIANYLDNPVDDHWYRMLCTALPDGAWAADFSNLYALLPSSEWRRIRSKVGELRVIYTLRDPVERLWSHAKFHLRITGQADAIAQWPPERMEAFVRQPFIWENAEYGAALRRMRDALPEDALRVIVHEALHGDERAGLAEIEAFLGIAHQDYPEDLRSRRVNPTSAEPVPPAFRARVQRDVDRILAELRSEGIALPPGWGAPGTSPEQEVA